VTTGPAVTTPSSIAQLTPSGQQAQFMGQQPTLPSTSDIRDLRAGMQQLQGKVNQVTTQLSNLTNTINTLSKTGICKPATTQPAAAVKTVIKKVILIPRRIYSVRAVIPGRAWLHATDGYLTTVKVGDVLCGYGTIQLINAREGKVYTSGGDVIQYGINDS
jgi:intracellular multiplication protein IcmG